MIKRYSFISVYNSKIDRMKKNAILFLILLIGFGLRIYGINWDQGYHLHPDERFLTMVANAEKIPAQWVNYFSPTRSSLNPYNVGYPFFVYGTFPLTFTKILAVFLGLDTYAHFTILGRFLSAFFDTVVIMMIYKIAELFEKKHSFDGRLKYYASFLYAIAVLPIQLSHFFAVDTFLNFFMIVSFYWSLKLYYFTQTKVFKDSVVYISLSAVFFGFAMGTKITGLFILPLILFFLVFVSLRKKQWMRVFWIVLLFMMITYITLRVADPKVFSSGNVFNPTVNPHFIQNLKELSRFSHKDAQYPPAVQWITKVPILFSLTNIAFFGLGIPYFILMIVGAYYLVRQRRIEIVMIFSWIVIFFLYQSSRFASTMRYFIFLYPFFAICAGYGLVKFLVKLQLKQIPSLNNPKKYYTPHFLGFPVSRHLFKVLRILLALILLLWTYSFMSIYHTKHSRVIASEWIEKNIPKTAFLAEEHWDDFLPVDGGYEGVQMPVFDPDTDQKWNTMNEILAKADYYIITSNRGYGSIMSVSDKYPRMSQFYDDLFKERLAFRKIAEFTSYPTAYFGIFNLTFNDDWAEEAFTVYDHPKVTIFKKIKPWISIN